MFIELRSIEETDVCMQLDGIILVYLHFLTNYAFLKSGKGLRIRRPKDFDKYPTVKGSRSVP